ncbi:lipid A export permease/ATP-binding protein MsbA [Magnetospirillum fulvum]|uniref:ATP-binding cassette, subfamily B, MsbA n=1 Tax=Magnetospirillum fulvum TaxID=1082 RepID=A0A1H6GXX3_MAGFU|nr:lipid A export permease/ATP-binding protein MsbA [Magnetospirillum fulvum]SEH28036.1 ATP-binding cassette, subfamily B, MsbA [Magnetospirillum fulvum]
MTKQKITFDHSTRVLVRRLFREGMRPYLGKVALAVLCMVVGAAANAAYALLMDPVVNKIFTERQSAFLLPLGLAVLAAFAVKALCNYGEAVFLSRVGLRVIADMQMRLFSHLMRLDVAYFQANSTGKILSRLTNDISQMRFAVSDALTGAGKDASSLIFLIAAMFYQDWELSLWTFFVFPLAILPISKLGRRMRKVTANTQEQMGLLTTYLEQSVQGIRVVKAYGMEDYEKTRVRTLVETLQDLVYRAARVRSASSPIMEFLGGVAITVVILYGGSRVIDGHTTPGAFFSFITALMLAYRPLKSLASLNTNLQEGLAAAARTFSVLDAQPEIQDHPGARDLLVREGNVRFEGVFFTYDGSRAVLDGIDLTVPGGRTVALVGPSGAGKSTLLNLLPRFFDVTDGRVTIDGQDIRDITMTSLRSKIALVSQEITLFDDTIRANIAYGRPGASDDEIIQAAHAAAAHEFIMGLPDGYDTIVGERGLNLSGGQRQRIAIARAMLKNAPILLLDEATSALDTESEHQIQAALDRLMRGRTTIVIAHRLSTVVGADLIHVMDRGRVVESGTHAMLVEQGGLYARLYAMQFAEETAASGTH